MKCVRYLRPAELAQLNRELEIAGKLRLKELEKRLAGRVYRPIIGARISEDHGKTWKLRALCDECAASIEPPTRAKREGPAGAMSCDWCGARNEQ